MKKLLTYSFYILALAAMPLLSACDGYNYGPWGWHHVGGWGPGWGHPVVGGGGHWGGGHGGGGGHIGGGGHGGGHGGGGHHLAAGAKMESSNQLAQDYSISPASAAKIIDLAQGDTQVKTLTELGVSVTDVAPLASLQMPSQDSIQKIANSLGEDSTKIEKVMSGFISDIQAEKDNSGSN